MRWLFRWSGFIVIGLSLAACATAVPTPTASPPDAVTPAETLARYSFDEDDPATWDVYTLDNDQAVFRVNGGALEGAVVADRGYIWSLENIERADVAVSATVRQIQGEPGAAYGLMCRADDAGNGYSFVISSAGYFALLRADPGVDNPLQLVEWRQHPALRVGSAANDLQIICAGERLAFYANGELLAAVADAAYASGEIGLTLGAVGATAWARFDTIVVQSVSESS